MKINSIHGAINIPDYVISCIEKSYRSKQTDIHLKQEDLPKYKFDKTKSLEISENFDDILNQKIDSMKKR